MGYYKNLLIKAEAGSKEACLTIAKDFLQKQDLQNAARWFEKAGDSLKAEKIRKQIKEEQDV